MKKTLLAIMLIFTLLVVCSAAFSAEMQSYTLEGLITEVGEGYFIMADIGQGEVRVNLDDTVTAYDGVASKDGMTIEQYVYVRYNGVLTRDVPPQVTAEKVSCYVVSGTATDILDNAFTVEGDTVLGTVLVHGYEGMPPVYRGVPITLYYNGVMALSYPPQITAAYLVVPTLTGIVSSAGESGFTLTTDSGMVYTVAVTEETTLFSLPADGERVTAYYDGLPENETTVSALAVAVPEAENGQSAPEI
ncbi:MAG: hypothetical protein LLF96_03780 [Eubacteriales bacterium]|nr:hypothetical protein [Eubacteriales bacterium]